MGNVNNVVILLIGFCVMHNTFSNLCAPCVEIKQCNISYMFIKNGSSPEHFLWRKDDSDIFTCYVLHYTECDYNLNQQPLEKAYIHLRDEDIYLGIVFTANRQNKTTSEGKWDLFSFENEVLKHLYSCEVKLYKQIEEINCTFLASYIGIEIKCTSHHLFPKSACQFSLSYKQIILNQMAVHYNHSITNTDPIYYTTECSVTVPQKLLKTGVLKYQVTMFPNISRFARKEIEKTAEGTINIEDPMVDMVSCPDFVEEGNIINCTCKRYDKSYIPTLVNWDNAQATNDKKAVLLETAFQNKTDFVCKAINDLGWLSKKHYRPTIKTKKKKSNNESACSSNKPYNCSNECYGDDEFCINDAVYSCLSLHNDKQLQKWCVSINVSDTVAGASQTCHAVCLHRRAATQDQESYLILIISLICVTILLLGIIGIIIKWAKCHHRLLQLLKPQNSINRNQSAVPNINNVTGCRATTEEQNADFPLLEHCNGPQVSILPSQHEITEQAEETDEIDTSVQYLTNIVENQESIDETEIIPLEECYERELNLSFQIKTDVNNTTFDETPLIDNPFKISSEPQLSRQTSEIVEITFNKVTPYRCVKEEACISISETISQLKECLASKLKIPANEQVWEFAGRVLEDGECLKNYNIKSEDNITVTSRRE